MQKKENEPPLIPRWGKQGSPPNPPQGEFKVNY